jgi:hypothetical protein
MDQLLFVVLFLPKAVSLELSIEHHVRSLTVYGVAVWSAEGC